MKLVVRTTLNFLRESYEYLILENARRRSSWWRREQHEVPHQTCFTSDKYHKWRYVSLRYLKIIYYHVELSGTRSSEMKSFLILFLICEDFDGVNSRNFKTKRVYEYGEVSKWGPKQHNHYQKQYQEFKSIWINNGKIILMEFFS